MEKLREGKGVPHARAAAVQVFGERLLTGEIDYSVFVFFLVDVRGTVVAVVLAIFISNLSSDKIAHVHIYATTILCVFF